MKKNQLIIGIIILSFFMINLFTYIQIKDKNEKNYENYQTTFNEYNKLIKNFKDKLKDIKENNKKIDNFEKLKQENKIFYLKKFLEYNFPNNSNNKKVLITNKDKNTIEYYDNNLNNILKLIVKFKKNPYIQSVSYKQVGLKKGLYVLKLIITNNNLEKFVKEILYYDYEVIILKSIIY